MGPEASLHLLAVAVLLSSKATPRLRPHLGIGVGALAPKALRSLAAGNPYSSKQNPQRLYRLRVLVFLAASAHLVSASSY